jgi:actin-related protein 3
VTHVVPVVDGYVLGASIRSMDLAGRDITRFIHGMIRDRGEVVPPEDLAEVAKRVKERDCYVCKVNWRSFIVLCL